MKLLPYFILILLFSPLIWAEVIPPVLEDGQENSTYNVLLDIFPPFFKKASLLVGGIFGLYFILLVVRIFYEQNNLKILKDIRYDLDRLNEHYGISYSHAKKGKWKKIKEIFLQK